MINSFSSYMKKVFIVGLLFSFLVSFAQTTPSPQKSKPAELPNPAEKIMEESEGNIVIDIPETILKAIMTPIPGTGMGGKTNFKKGINHLNGYRIQVFSDGRDQSTLESRARARGNMVLSRFPKYKGQVYTYSNSPNWFTRVGNFQTTEEANKALTELRQAFPSISSEMRIVKSQIVVIGNGKQQ